MVHTRVIYIIYWLLKKKKLAVISLQKEGDKKKREDEHGKHFADIESDSIPFRVLPIERQTLNKKKCNKLRSIELRREQTTRQARKQ